MNTPCTADVPLFVINDSDGSAYVHEEAQARYQILLSERDQMYAALLEQLSYIKGHTCPLSGYEREQIMAMAKMVMDLHDAAYSGPQQ